MLENADSTAARSDACAYLELLRRTLGRLRDLTPDALAPRRAEIDAAEQGARAAAERDHADTLEAATARRDASIAAAATAYRERRTAIETRFHETTDELTQNLDNLTTRIGAQERQSLDEARREHDERVLMADTVAPATIEGYARERAAHERRLDGLDAARAQLTETAAGWCRRFGVDLPQPDVTEAAGDPADALQRADQLVTELSRLALPRWMAGATPYALGAGFVLIVAGGGLALALAGLAGGLPPWLVAVLAGGLALAGALAGGRWLRRRAQDEALGKAGSAVAALEAGRLAAEDARTAARERFERARAETLAHRDEEVAAADRKLAERRARAEGQRATALEKLEQEYAAKLQGFTEQREQRLGHAREQQERQQAEARRACERAVAAADRVRSERIADARSQRETALAALREQSDAAVGDLRRLLARSDELELPDYDWRGGDPPPWLPADRFAVNVPLGRLKVELAELDEIVRRREDFPQSEHSSLQLPVPLPLPRRGAVLIEADRAGRRAALGLLRSIVVRILTGLPAGRAHLTVFDPLGLGESFAGLMHLADYHEALLGGRIWTESAQLEARLADLTGHMETVIQKYLRNEFETIAAYNAQAGELAEPYRFLVVADYPVNFSPAALERLRSVARSGARCGVFPLVICDRDRLTPDARDTLEELRECALVVEHTPNGLRMADATLAGWPLEVEPPPDEQQLTRIVQAVGRGAEEALQVEVPFASLMPADTQRWAGSSAAELAAPIGRTGATRVQRLRLGSGLAQHALVAGQTGSGKSTLLHVLITNLALTYSPDELELYLIDFKQGVEFQGYARHRLPHARAVAIESDREFGLSVLERITAELDRRGELFRRAGVQDIAAYRAGQPGDPLPRTLLIVDEFQVFFAEDDRLAQAAAALLDRLVRQGRAFGIHLLLGSQTLAGSVALARSTLGQMAVRIALQCSEADAQLIMDDTNTAARLLSRPGEALYNDQGGAVDANSPFQTAWLSDEQRTALLAEIAALAGQRGVQRPPPIVFEGNVPADIRDIAPLRAAQPPSTAGGMAQSPSVAATPTVWLGAPVAIKPPTHVALPRQPGAHLLIVGQDEVTAMAEMTAAAASLAAGDGRAGPADLRLVLLDGTPEDRAGDNTLRRLGTLLPERIETVAYRAVGERIGALAEVVQQRVDGTGGGDATIVLIVHGLQRYRVLRRGADDYSFSLDEEAAAKPDRQLAAILRDGPAVGVHVLAWCDTLTNLERTLERATLSEFDNRLLLQMSAADSGHLIDSPEANRLGANRALLYSAERGVMEKLRPFGPIEEDWLREVCGAPS